jgi:hypothetical protein
VISKATLGMTGTFAVNAYPANRLRKLEVISMPGSLSLLYSSDILDLVKRNVIIDLMLS